MVTPHEFEQLKMIDLWLCGRWDGESSEETYRRTQLAMMALQIICPSGGKNLFLTLDVRPGGYDTVGSRHRAEMHTTPHGRITSVEQTGLRNFSNIYGGLLRAFSEKIVRLQNPVLLLEHGLQATNIYIRTLLWATGLDMLFMAGGDDRKFSTRVSNFLGPETLVFKPDSIMHRQPKYTVQEVVPKVYALRNLIAHGSEIPKSPWRDECGFVDGHGRPINLGPFYYAQLIEQSALFLLCAALRQIFADQLVNEVRTVSAWRKRLKC